jgi:hypothetical protein
MATMLEVMLAAVLILFGVFILSPFIIGLFFLIEIVADMLSKYKR